MLFRKIALLVILLGSGIALAQDESPQIYYYSAEQRAFIVENVDGSQSKLLVEYAIPKYHDYVEGAGWSASGDWFAWSSRGSGGGGYGGAMLYVWNDELSVLRTLDLKPANLIEKMLWSPTDDYLLILHFDTRDVFYLNISLYDAMNDEMLIQQPRSEYFLLDTEWSTNGKYFSVAYPSITETISVDGHVISEIRTDNNLEDQDNIFVSELQDKPLPQIPFSENVETYPYVTPIRIDDTVVVLVADDISSGQIERNLYRYDVDTETLHKIDIDEAYLRNVSWAYRLESLPNTDYVFLISGPLNEYHYKTSIINIKTSEFRELALCGLENTDSCYGLIQ